MTAFFFSLIEKLIENHFLFTFYLLPSQINQAQAKVDHLKEMMNKGASSRSLSNELDMARQSRDQSHDTLVQLLVGKALVQASMDVAQHVYNIKVGLNESCQQYTRLYTRLLDEKAIVRQTMDKKVSF